MPRDQVKVCLDATPNDKVDWNFWDTVGMGVLAATQGADYGLEEWKAWLTKVTPAGVVPPSAISTDPLDFVMTTADDAVQRINTEYFFRRDTSEICRQVDASGEIQVLTHQQLKAALAGRWVEGVDPKTDKAKVRDAATVWLESRKRREVHGVQYCPNNIGLRQGHLNLWHGWGIQPGLGDCSIVLHHIR